ncbi:hypothetical protein ABZY57_15230 [Streptomyces sp. NPDC006450]|uniref:hypothetical protein n=1 Tax=Streptomyces sp. NPDC006450 TaxID=3155458 RepID=UPI0033BE0835
MAVAPHPAADRLPVPAEAEVRGHAGHALPAIDHERPRTREGSTDEETRAMAHAL